MKFTFIHLVCLLGLIACKKNSHHKHRTKHRREFFNKNMGDFDEMYSKIVFDNNKYYSGHLKSYNLVDNYYRNPDIESESEIHRIRHRPELIQYDMHWPVKKEAVVEGDIILGGLMMVHEREDTITCGPVMPQGGIQALEAMLYTLDRLNNDLNPLLPNISIGAHILDDCDKDTYGLEMAVDFIKGKSQTSIKN